MGWRVLKSWRREFFAAALMLADFLAIFGAFVAAYWIRYRVPALGAAGEGPGFHFYGSAIALMVLLWLPIFSKFGLYQVRGGWRLADLLFSSTYAVSVAMAFFLAASYLLGWLAYSRLLLGFVWVASVAGIVSVRWSLKHALLFCRSHGIGVRRLVIVGDGPAGGSLRKTIDLHPELGYEVIGMVSPAGRVTRDGGVDEAIYEGTGDLVRQLAAEKVDDVVLALPLGNNEGLQEFVAACQERRMTVRLVPDLYHTFSLSPQLAPIENVPLLALRHDGLSSWERLGKRLLDLLVAPLLLVLTAPGLLVVAASLRRRRGRVLERVVRIGQYGAPFEAWRLAVPAEAAARRGRLEDWAARYSVTEVPQLWNVVRGEMSLVGPRPEGPERTRRYNAWHRRRLMVKPGLTGLAQVNGLRGFASSDEKTRFDLQYIETLSLRLDLKILLQTAWTLLSRMRGGLGRLGSAGRVPEGAARELSRLGQAQAARLR